MNQPLCLLSCLPPEEVGEEWSRALKQGVLMPVLHAGTGRGLIGVRALVSLTGTHNSCLGRYCRSPAHRWRTSTVHSEERRCIKCKELEF